MEWKDINIRQYQDILREIDEEYPTDLDRAIGILSALTTKPISYYTDEIPYKELTKKIRAIEFIKEKPAATKIHSKIKVGKKRFKFNLNMRTINFGNYMDLSQMVRDNKSINENMHTILAVMCEEIDFWGNTIKTTAIERAEYLKENLTMDYVFSLSGFFLSNYQKLIIATNDYLESEMKKMNKKANKVIHQALSSIGDGITP